MLELGENSAALHFGAGELAKSLGIELVLTYGEESAQLALGAERISRHFESKAELLDALGEFIHPGDAVLVKASRGMKFEEVTEKLKNI